MFFLHSEWLSFNFVTVVKQFFMSELLFRELTQLCQWNVKGVSVLFPLC